MKTIYLVDYLGIHTGVGYYLSAFKKLLEENMDVKVKILSNYSEEPDTTSFFVNQYNGSIIQKGLSLIYNIWKLNRHVLKHKDSIYIYEDYGNRIDISFIKAVAKSPMHLIDIHEAIAQDVDSNKILKDQLRQLYCTKVKSVISHAPRTDSFLKEFGYNGQKFFVPHFRYNNPTEYDLEMVPIEIRNAPINGLINILFFGNLNESKGVDILIDAVNKLEDDVSSKLNVIIAGKDFDGAVDRIPPAKGRNLKIFRRKISDNELCFLFSNVNYIALPYRKTSQSGILEMAFHFKKPIIASNVEYFRKTLLEFPSFGIIAGMGAEDYASALKEIIVFNGKREYFKNEEYNHYLNRSEVEVFIEEIKKWIKIGI